MDSSFWINFPAVVGIVALILAAYFFFRVKALPEGNETMNRIAGYIREGSMAFLKRQYQALAVFGVVVFVLIGLSLGWLPAACFLAGAILSLFAGFIGMKAATYANVRTAQMARGGSKANALLVALDGGAVMGLSVAGLGTLGLGVVYMIFRDSEILPNVIHAFAVGASSIALFARIGGGIYTKAADVGSDIAGKVIENIPEDDPRNPGVIADNVGDNVGDVAGMGADIYESMVAAIVAAMAIAITSPAASLPALLVNGGDEASSRLTGIMLPLALSTIGLVVSIFTIFITRIFKNMDPAKVLRLSLIIPPVVLAIVSFVLMPILGISQGVTIAITVGAFRRRDHRSRDGLLHVDVAGSAHRRSVHHRRGHEPHPRSRGRDGIGRNSDARRFARRVHRRSLPRTLRDCPFGSRNARRHGRRHDGRCVRTDLR